MYMQATGRPKMQYCFYAKILDTGVGGKEFLDKVPIFVEFFIWHFHSLSFLLQKSGYCGRWSKKAVPQLFRAMDIRLFIASLE